MTKARLQGHLMFELTVGHEYKRESAYILCYKEKKNLASVSFSVAAIDFSFDTFVLTVTFESQINHRFHQPNE